MHVPPYLLALHVHDPVSPPPPLFYYMYQLDATACKIPSFSARGLWQPVCVHLFLGPTGLENHKKTTRPLSLPGWEKGPKGGEWGACFGSGSKWIRVFLPIRIRTLKTRIRPLTNQWDLNDVFY